MAQRRKVLSIVALLLGSALIAAGTVSSLLYVFLPFTYHGQDVVAANVTLASAAALTLGLGFILSYHARNSLKGKHRLSSFPLPHGC